MTTPRYRGDSRAPTRHFAARLAVCGLVLVASPACTLIDPSPYSPFDPPSGVILPFSNKDDDAGFKTISETLLQMASGYTNKRNDLIKDQALVDVVLLGLTSAAVINPIYHGANAATIALGLSAGTVGAAKIYFAPQTRVSLYNAAAFTLSCAAGVGGQMSGWYSKYGDIVVLEADLKESLALASAYLIDGKATGDVGTRLISARDTALASLTKLREAKAALDGGAGRLRSLALATVNTTSKSVVAGTQNIDAALARINSLAPGAPAGAAAPPGAPPPTDERQIAARTTIATPGDVLSLANNLVSSGLAADALAIPINETWSTLSSCS